ncbi:type II toxin-antitoxin system RelE/ParE family toxin [uncultured Microbulbifer sp.]|uniref:type II toxin-antitoxin system RelE/ParE family toxin n=1 Tax=uncultured Microbulbifer sp. TaxID=348147 RepID=UPI002628FA19|nr:type II toxin-antitoxin system RelE/ParE family toxin [uncultured Microbulbifer sp.]
MIKSFKHKGLEELWVKGRSRRIDSRPAIQKKLIAIMTRLDAVASEQELTKIGKDVHPLQGRKGTNSGNWAVWVTGNFRITFNFDGRDAEILDYEDYH